MQAELTASEELRVARRIRGSQYLRALLAASREDGPALRDVVNGLMRDAGRPTIVRRCERCGQRRAVADTLRCAECTVDLGDTR